MSKGTPVRWPPEREAELLEAWDKRPIGQKAIEFDRAHAKSRGASTGLIQKKRCALLKARKATVWTKVWPTEPGWYWIRDGHRPPAVWHVRRYGPAPGRLVHQTAGRFAYEPEFPHVMWGPRIPEPE